MITPTARFALKAYSGSNAVMGWTGYVLDNQTGVRYELVKIVKGISMVYDTKKEFIDAGRKMISTLTHN